MIWVARYKPREPEITFDGRLTLSRGGDVTIKVFEMQRHVAEDTAVYVPGDKVLFTNDDIFHGTITWYHEPLLFEWLETLDHF